MCSAGDKCTKLLQYALSQFANLDDKYKQNSPSNMQFDGTDRSHNKINIISSSCRALIPTDFKIKSLIYPFLDFQLTKLMLLFDVSKLRTTKQDGNFKFYKRKCKVFIYPGSVSDKKL